MIRIFKKAKEKQETSKPKVSKCYSCKHRREIPGDAHSKCVHPAVGNNKDIFDAMADIALAMGGIDSPVSKAAKQLRIRANVHGIKNGWFFWPANFDPVWLEHCDGYEKK